MATGLIARSATGKNHNQASDGHRPTFDTTTQVVDYLGSHGLGCGTEVPGANPSTGVEAVSNCGDVVISEYDSDDEARSGEQALDRTLRATGSQGYAVVCGRWLLSLGTDRDYAGHVATLLHEPLHPVGVAR